MLFKGPNISSHIGGIPLLVDPLKAGKNNKEKKRKKLGSIKFIPYMRVSLICGSHKTGFECTSKTGKKLAKLACWVVLAEMMG